MRSVELVAPLDEAVDGVLHLRSLRHGCVYRSVGLVLQVRLGERVSARGSVVGLAVGEEDVEHQRVRCRLDAHLLQQLGDGELPSEGILREDGDGRGSDEARLRVEADELVGPIGRAGGRGLDGHRGLRRVHRSLAEGVRAHQSGEQQPVTREDQPLAPTENSGVLAEVDDFFGRRRGSLHPSLHLCSIPGSRRTPSYDGPLVIPTDRKGYRGGLWALGQRAERSIRDTRRSTLRRWSFVRSQPPPRPLHLVGHAAIRSPPVLARPRPDLVLRCP